MGVLYYCVRIRQWRRVDCAHSSYWRRADGRDDRAEWEVYEATTQGVLIYDGNKSAQAKSD